MKSILLLAVFVCGQVFAGSEYCMINNWGYTYSARHNLFCGKSGQNLAVKGTEQEVQSKKREMGLFHLDSIEAPGLTPVEILSRAPETIPGETIVVYTTELLSIGFFKKHIGYKHSIVSSHGIESKIQDDLSNSKLNRYLWNNGFSHIISAKLSLTDIKVYLKR